MTGKASYDLPRTGRASDARLTTMSGLALGLAVSAGLWAGVAEMMHLLGVF